jgi:DNA-binding FadR family transcriptional regulator
MSVLDETADAMGAMTQVPVPMPQRLTLADQTVLAIEALLAGLPAGAVLPCEDALAVRFTVSRVTVRKALARLVARGMVAGGGRGKRRVVVGGSIITRGTSILSMNRPKRRG